jgi:hypothetical protein
MKTVLSTLRRAAGEGMAKIFRTLYSMPGWKENRAVFQKLLINASIDQLASILFSEGNDVKHLQKA